MLVFWKARFVLLAVPKTGTTALEAALAPLADAAILNPPGLKHCGVAKYRKDLAPFFEQRGRRPLELVAVMREPVSWLGSWYRYRSRPALDGLPNSTAEVDFAGFVEAYLADDPPEFAKLGSQARMLSGGVDHLFRHDRPDALRTFVTDRLGPVPEPERRNVSPDGVLELPPALLDRLRTERAEDFALWERLVAGTP
ncbi:gamma-glutamyl kinase [Jannaschia formosa]|uniref:gamma-glutamyl kinase n=1 Tax=Jannaschia formosa TaxID=2259592 RepID=UPI000E1C27F3|nr:gamma-glutamyl kinase [Jannaschia formosa]TFL17059.1 gamma-glutamyl kinase [Jannaschia formosa]